MKSRVIRIGAAFSMIVLLSIAGWNAVLAQETEPDFAAIDAYVEGQVKELNLPGLALGIVHHDEVVHLLSAGIADPSGRAVTPQTPFMTGSLTKSFTALAIMQLVEAGRVELDAPVQRYLPWFAVADADASARITVRHLLNQTSGLSTMTGNAFIASQATGEQEPERFLRSLSTAELTYPVGEGFAYSNGNYAALGMIVELISGVSYEQYIQEHILTPLDMHNTFVSYEEAKQHGLAMGYQPRFGILTPVELPVPSAYVAAGSISSSAEDMTHYLIAFLNGGRYGDATILSPAGIAELWQSPSYLALDKSPYTMGWYTGWQYKQYDLYIRDHTGNTGNFSAYMAVGPDSGWGIVLLVNEDHAALVTPSINLIGWSVVSMLHGQPAPQSINIVQGMYFATFIIVALQFLCLIWGVFRLRRWNRHPASRPQGVIRILLRVILPILLNLFAAWIFVSGFTNLIGAPLDAVLLHMPDWGSGFVLGALLAAGWLVWGVAALVTLRRKASPVPEQPVNAST
jgi:CubicO group peptidase (beta-lactamase class C family)